MVIICVSGPKDGEYCGVDVDMNDFSDQSMTLAAIAPFAKQLQSSRILNIYDYRNQTELRLWSTSSTILALMSKREEIV